MSSGEGGVEADSRTRIYSPKRVSPVPHGRAQSRGRAVLQRGRFNDEQESQFIRDSFRPSPGSKARVQQVVGAGSRISQGRTFPTPPGFKTGDVVIRRFYGDTLIADTELPVMTPSYTDEALEQGKYSMVGVPMDLQSNVVTPLPKGAYGGRFNSSVKFTRIPLPNASHPLLQHRGKRVVPKYTRRYVLQKIDNPRLLLVADSLVDKNYKYANPSFEPDRTHDQKLYVEKQNLEIARKRKIKMNFPELVRLPQSDGSIPTAREYRYWSRKYNAQAHQDEMEWKESRGIVRPAKNISLPSAVSPVMAPKTRDQLQEEASQIIQGSESGNKGGLDSNANELITEEKEEETQEAMPDTVTETEARVEAEQSETRSETDKVPNAEDGQGESMPADSTEKEGDVEATPEGDLGGSEKEHEKGGEANAEDTEQASGREEGVAIKNATEAAEDGDGSTEATQKEKENSGQEGEEITEETTADAKVEEEQKQEGDEGEAVESATLKEDVEDNKSGGDGDEQPVEESDEKKTEETEAEHAAEGDAGEEEKVAEVDE
eukprot:Nk52_evm19s163 gene=Nk52_evmTU19s163